MTYVEDLRAVALRTVPLARMRRDDIRKMREWSSEHAISASSHRKAVAELPGQRQSRVARYGCGGGRAHRSAGATGRAPAFWTSTWMRVPW